MHRVTASTRAVDLFGSGKHGYTDGVPQSPSPTELNSDAMNMVQEELVRTVEDRNITLDSGNYNQLSTAMGVGAMQTVTLTTSGSKVIDPKAQVANIVCTTADLELQGLTGREIEGALLELRSHPTSTQPFKLTKSGTPTAGQFYGVSAAYGEFFAPGDSQLFRYLSGAWRPCGPVHRSTPTVFPTINSNAHNWSLNAGCSVIYVNPTANVDVTGLKFGSAGRRLTIANTSTSFNVSIVMGDALSDPANRIGYIGETTLVLQAHECLDIVYNATSLRWYAINF